MSMIQDLTELGYAATLDENHLSGRQRRRANYLPISASMMVNIIGLHEPITFEDIIKQLPLYSHEPGRSGLTRPQRDALATHLGKLRRAVRQEWGTGYIIMTSHKGETHYKLTPGARKQWRAEILPMLKELSEEAA